MMVFSVHQHELTMGIHVSPPSWSPLPPPSHPILLGCPTALALGALFHALNLHQSSTLHTVMYHSLKSSHPCLPLLSPKVCYLHLCFLCWPTCRITGSVFLSSIYIFVNIEYLSFSFWLTSLCIIGSWFIHLIRSDSNAFLFIAK